MVAAAVAVVVLNASACPSMGSVLAASGSPIPVTVVDVRRLEIVAASFDLRGAQRAVQPRIIR